MTPAELLLAAADRIDQTRADATPGPWTHNHTEGCCVYGADAAWIALLNPQTGEHIAALLRVIGHAHGAGQVTPGSAFEQYALDLARAILGGAQ